MYDVYISYHPNYGKDFMLRLSSRLQLQSYSVNTDRQNLSHLKNELPQHLADAIEQSHNFVFIISPDAMQAEQCLQELNLAVEFKKRIIPVLHSKTDSGLITELLPPVLKKHNWLSFISEDANAETTDIKDFEAWNELIRILETEKPYIQQHTSLLTLSKNWQQNGNKAELLLDKDQLEEAMDWLLAAANTKTHCQPTLLQCEYIAESKIGAMGQQTDTYFCNIDTYEQISQNIYNQLISQNITNWLKPSIEAAGQSSGDIKFMAIERAANFIFFISQDILLEPEYLEQVAYAVRLNKRIIPVLVEKVVKKTIPSEVRKLVMIDLSNSDHDAIQAGVKKLTAAINKNAQAFNTHRDILTRCLEWERNNKDIKYLLRGLELELATKWLRESEHRADYVPTLLQRKFIEESSKTKLTVFISYGRKQSKHFATRLNDQLSALNYDVWFDQNNIPLAVDFQEQINAGIEKSDNFIFIISPHSLLSQYCRVEIDLAIKYGKRIIPILHIEPQNREQSDAMHPVIVKLNWLYFREKYNENLPMETWQPIEDFDQAIKQLSALLEHNTGYVKMHSQLLQQALDWERNLFANRLLLEGRERIEAEQWLRTDFKNEQPPCTPVFIQSKFIAESRKKAEDGMSDVFISYSEHDKKFKEKLYNDLLMQGITISESGEATVGLTYEEAVHTAIEKASSLVYILSNNSAISEYCLEEISHALIFEVRIIIILIEETPKSKWIDDIRDISYLDFTTETGYGNTFDDLIRELNRDKDYFDKHKIIFTKAIQWKRQKSNKSMLLSGFELEQAELWLRLGEQRQHHRPVPLHYQFIEKSRNLRSEYTPDVFIAHSPYERDFANLLNKELKSHSKNTWFDHDYIPAKKDYQKYINLAIDEVHTFLILLSPESVIDQEIQRQIDYAIQQKKKIVPILYRKISVRDLPQNLKKIEWIDFAKSKDNFHAALSDLLRTLEVDRNYLDVLQKYQKKANEWLTAKRSKDYLLPSTEVETAKAWLNNAIEQKHQLRPGAEVVEFIDESVREVQQKRTKAIKRNRLLVTLLTMSLLALVVAIVFIFMAISARRNAENLRQFAEEQRLLAIEARKNAERQNEVLKIALFDPQKAKVFILSDQLKNDIKMMESEPVRNSQKLQQMKWELASVDSSIAQILFYLRDFDGSVRIADDICRLYEELEAPPKQKNSAYTKKAVYMLYNADYDNALQTLQKADSLIQNEPITLVYSALTNLFAGNHQTAIDDYTQFKDQLAGKLPYKYAFWEIFTALSIELPGNKVDSLRNLMLQSANINQLMSDYWTNNDRAIAYNSPQLKAVYYNYALQNLLIVAEQSNTPDTRQQVNNAYSKAAYYFLLAEKYHEAIHLAGKSVMRDNEREWDWSIMVAALLLSNQVDEANKIVNTASRKMRQQALFLLNELQFTGVNHPDMERYKSIVSNSK